MNIEQPDTPVAGSFPDDKPAAQVLSISVIVAVGPHCTEVPIAVTSALAEVAASGDAELVVVDDEAVDSVRLELARLEGTARIRHNLLGRFGLAGALAAGAAAASGQLLIFVGGEAELLPGSLACLRDAFAQDPGVGFAQHAGIHADATAPAVAVLALALTSIGGVRALYEELPPVHRESSTASSTGVDGARFLLHPVIVRSLERARWRSVAVPMVLDAAPGVAAWDELPGAARGIERVLFEPLAVSRRTRPGLNVIGLLEAACGIGDAARRYVEALATTGIDYATYAYHGHASPPFPYEGHGPRDLPYDCTLFALNAEILPGLAYVGGPELWVDRYSIGLWFWELEELSPAMQSGLGLVNELWVATRFLQRAFSSGLDRRVVTVPLPVRRRSGQPHHGRDQLGLPNAFTFLTVFDFGSLAVRKNSLGVVRAFTSAFSPGEGPVLVLKTLNAGGDELGRRQLTEAIGGRRDVMILDGYLSDEVISEMIGSADCFVSLHRSEGFGLTPAEAMAWGRPVIATGYSGNLDFMNKSNSYLVDWDRTEVPADLVPVYPTGSYWAEPRIEHAAALMREVYLHPAEASAVGERAQREIRQTNSLSAAARVITQRLEEIGRQRRRATGGGRPTPRRRIDRRPATTAGVPR